MIRFSGLPKTLKNFPSDLFKQWLKEVVCKEKFSVGDIFYIFCDDDYLIEINKKFLNHDNYTDIITFSTSKKNNIISGEIYISIERVKENSKNRKDTFIAEVARVMVHGILHLMGYGDQAPDEKNEMRQKENNYLSLLSLKNS
ncbi:MAG TPA: rRNA maturation RNase YbeY [Bacteroidetes bacterium]|nr:rRNA maturation RNase YbeY [Bacteroidota bacterium]